MKAIETAYKGYRFRSRTEARWAVYFDALGVKWEYEKEGFVMPDGTWYLPDFYLPDHGLWAEVKGGEFTNLERQKCEELARLGNSVVMLDGVPDFKPYNMLAMDPHDHRIYEDDIIIVPEGEKYYPWHWGCYGEFDCDYWTSQSEAVVASRSARFEHGEKGGVNA